MLSLTSMRQRGDSAFAELLCRVRTASCTNDDIAVTKVYEWYPLIALTILVKHACVQSEC